MQLARYLIAPAGSLAQTSSATHIPICTTYLDEFFVLVISQFRGYPKQGVSFNIGLFDETSRIIPN
jgi:hypothetical protein